MKKIIKFEASVYPIRCIGAQDPSKNELMNTFGISKWWTTETRK